MVKGDRQAWKQAYFEKAHKLLSKYERIFICDADNVTSKQFQVRFFFEDFLVEKSDFDDFFRTSVLVCAVRVMFSWARTP